MLPFDIRRAACFVRRMAMCLAAAAVAGPVATCEAQVLIRQVGGVLVDASGVLSNVEADRFQELRTLRQQALAAVPGDLSQPDDLRKVSLRRLQEALAKHASGQPIPDEMKYLAGLQRIRYVFVYPEERDVVLVGYGEGWKVGDRGEVVGATTGRPVLQLDDLLVALRSATMAAQGGISCSIDPTADGLQRLQAFVSSQTSIGPDPAATIAGIEQQLGPQMITLTGVPPTSHFAQVLVAADYRMKRLAMAFDPAPVAKLPSYLHLVKSSSAGMSNMLPRWWLATHYEPLLTGEDGLAWELRGPGVKAMAEEDFLAGNGARQRTGKANARAQQWADTLTAKYDELSIKEPIFGELRNCMDLAVIAALIAKEQLAEKAGLEMALLLDADKLPVEVYDQPKQVDSKASFVKAGRNWMISASGGVQIHSWGVADRKEASTSLAPVHKQAAPTSATAWWWK